jgi:hypothetical protein
MDSVVKSKTVNINPHYVARLIGPIALASDMEQQEDIFELIDLACNDHVKFLVDEIINSEYLRLTDESQYKTKETLRYLLNTQPSGAVSHMCSMLGLSDDEIPIFLDRLWNFLFPSENKTLLPDLKYVKNSTPLRFDEVQFRSLPSRTLNESLDSLRNRMNIE